MAFAFTPTNANQVAVSYGIDHLFPDYIVSDETITENVDKVVIQDQKGKTAQVWGIQKYWNCSLTLTGPTSAAPCHAGSKYTWYNDGSNTTIDYFVDTCELKNTYNDTSKWSVTMEAYQGATYKNETGQD